MVPVLFAFYIQSVLKLKNNSGAKRLKYCQQFPCNCTILSRLELGSLAPQIPPCSAARDAIFTTSIILAFSTANSVPTPELMTAQRKKLIEDENCDYLDEDRVFISVKVILFLNLVCLTAMFSSPSINASPHSSKQYECVRGGGAVCVSNGVGGYVKAC